MQRFLSSPNWLQIVLEPRFHFRQPISTGSAFSHCPFQLLREKDDWPSDAHEAYTFAFSVILLVLVLPTRTPY